jgi:hypothetical protein
MVLLAVPQQARKWIRNSWHTIELDCSDHEVVTCGKLACCALTCGRMGIYDLRLAEIRNLYTHHSRLCKKISRLARKGYLRHTYCARSLYNGEGHH